MPELAGVQESPLFSEFFNESIPDDRSFPHRPWFSKLSRRAKQHKGISDGIVTVTDGH